MALRKSETDKWNEIMSRNDGVARLFFTMAQEGIPRKKLLDSYPYIVKALELLPMLDGSVDSELHDLFCQKMSSMEKSESEYQEKLEQLEGEYLTKLADIPKREAEVKRKEKALINADDYVERQHKSIELCAEEYRKRIEQEQDNLEKLKEKIYEAETAEARDRIRLAELYLNNVPQSNWTDKAIAWSLGAIYSGTQIPNFGKSE